MANPILGSFDELTDKFGTTIADMTVDFKLSLLRPWTTGWAMGAQFVTAVFMTIIGVGLFLLDLVVRQTLFIDVIGNAYQSALDWIYQFVNPMWIAMFALAIVITRMFVGDKLILENPKTKSGKIVGMKFEDRTFFDNFNEKGSFGKKVLNQLKNSLFLLIIIAVMMANPFLILEWLFNFVTSMSNQITSHGDGQGTVASIDGVVVPVLQMVNFGAVLGDACNQQWSRTLAGGGDVTKLGCLTSDQQSAASPGAETVITAIIGLVLLVALAYFSWQIFKKTTWFYVMVLLHVAKVPWVAAARLARPGSEREKLDSIKDAFTDAAAATAWLLGAIAIASAGPGLLMMIGTALVEAGMPAFIALSLVAVAYAAAGWAFKEFYGKKLGIKDKRLVVIEEPGTQGWGDFYSNYMVPVHESWTEAFGRGGHRDADEAAAVAAGGESVNEPGKQGVPVVSAYEAAAIDAATGVVDFVPTSVSASSTSIVVNKDLGAVTVAGAPRVSGQGQGQRLSAGVRLVGDGAKQTFDVNNGVAVDDAESVHYAVGMEPNGTGQPQVDASSNGGRHSAAAPSVSGGAKASLNGYGVQAGAVAGALPAGVDGSGPAGDKALVDADVVNTATTGAGSGSQTPEDRRESLAERHRRSIELLNSDGETSPAGDKTAVAEDLVDVATGGLMENAQGLSNLDDAAAEAFIRHQSDLREAGDHGGDAQRASVGSSESSFLDADRMTAEWEDTVVLARTLGVELKTHVVDSNSRVDVVIESSDNEGNNTLGLNLNKGFGDNI